MRTLRLPHFMKASVEVRQKMWYIGSGAMAISRPSLKLTEIHRLVCSRLESMLPWVSIAPLAEPVVPPVYCRKAMSSAVSLTRVNGLCAPRCMASSSGMASGMCHLGTIFLTCLTRPLISQRLGAGTKSPTWVLMTWRIEVSGSTF